MTRFLFLQNNSLSGVSRCLTQSQKRVSLPLVVSSNGRPADRNVSVLMENTLKEVRENATVIEKDSKSTVTGGVGDVYGEDSASEDQTITPWTFSVARLKRFNFSIMFRYFLCSLLELQIISSSGGEDTVNSSLISSRKCFPKYMTSPGF